MENITAMDEVLVELMVRHIYLNGDNDDNDTVSRHETAYKEHTELYMDVMNELLVRQIFLNDRVNNHNEETKNNVKNIEEIYITPVVEKLNKTKQYVGKNYSETMKEIAPQRPTNVFDLIALLS